MDYSVVCKKILQEVGGEENIKYVYHCATRLRFNLKDESIANVENLKKINGVLGTASKSGQFQVIIGPSADIAFKEFVKLGNFGSLDDKKEEKKKITVKSIFAGILDAISGSFNPILPAIIGCAMLKVLTLLLHMTGVLPETSQTYIILNFANDTAFYFMPLLLAVSAAKKFNCNAYLALAIAGLLFHPAFIGLVSNGKDVFLFGLPVALVRYSGTVFPIILIVWAQSYVERLVDKITPDMIKYFTKPLLVLLIMLPLTLCILGPVSTYASSIIAFIFTLISGKIGWLFSVVLAAALPFLVPVGMHSGIVPLVLNNLSINGNDATFFPSYLAFHFAIGGSGLAVALKAKGKELKQISVSTAITALLGGITEPILFGVHLKLKRPMIGVVVGGAVAAAYAGIVRLTAYVFAFPSITSVLMWKAPNDTKNIINAVITMVIGVVVAFVVTYFIGIGEENEETQDVENIDTVVSAVADGSIVDLKKL